MQDGDSDLNAKMEEAEADKDRPAPLGNLWGEISMAEGIAGDQVPVGEPEEANPSNARVPRKGKPKV